MEKHKTRGQHKVFSLPYFTDVQLENWHSQTEQVMWLRFSLVEIAEKMARLW